MSDDNVKSPPYNVGYGKPPQRTQFRKGQSGNPKGRPKGASSNKKRIRRMLEAPTPVKIGDEVRTLSTFELSLERLSEGVRKGDKTAIARVEGFNHPAFTSYLPAAARSADPDKLALQRCQLAQAFLNRL